MYSGAQASSRTDAIYESMQNEPIVRRAAIASHRAHITDMCSLKSALDNTGGSFVVCSNELATDDGRADGFCGIDDFLDTWYT